MFYNDGRNINLDNTENSYDYIVRNLNKSSIGKVLDYLPEKEIDKLFCYLEKNNIKTNYNGVVEKLIELEQKNIIKSHFSYFWKSNNHILKFKYLVKDLNMDFVEINNYINENIDLIIEEVSNYSINTLKDEKIYGFIKELIKELVEKEKIDYSDIELIGEGTSSRVFGIGSKVLKVGMPKEVFKMKNNKLFLQPIYRKEIKSIHRNESLMCVEITEKVDTENITDDDVYYIYKTLRDEGLIWLDHIKGNVGRLLKDNKIYFDGIDYVDKESTDYTTDNNKILPKGSLVIIDNDCIYDAEELFKSVEYRMFGHCSIYEARYREEKENEERSKGRL